jgi:hypothetical protein
MRFDTLHISLIIAVAALVLLVGYMLLRPSRNEGLVLPPPTGKADPVPRNTQQPEATMVLFHSRGCGHCVRMLPAWKECIKELTGKVRFVEVQDQDAMQYGIRGFPTIRFYPNGHLASKEFTEYRGDRSKGSLEKFALSGGKEM